MPTGSERRRENQLAGREVMVDFARALECGRGNAQLQPGVKDHAYHPVLHSNSRIPDESSLSLTSVAIFRKFSGGEVHGAGQDDGGSNAGLVVKYAEGKDVRLCGSTNYRDAAASDPVAVELSYSNYDAIARDTDSISF